METFFYKAKDKNGKIVSGEVESASSKEVANLLRSHDLFIIQIIPNQKRTLSRLFDPKTIGILGFRRRVSGNDIVYFTRQFASMITAGLTVTEALALLSRETKNKALSDLLKSVLASIEGGNSLSVALSWHADVFPEVYIALIKASEAAGLLDKVLLRLADNLEREREFKSKVKGALVYPVIVVVGIVAVMFVMMIFVVPRLNELYKTLDVELPLVTRIVVSLSTFITNFWFLFFGLIVMAVFAFNVWKRTEFGMRQVDRILLKLPVFGKLSEKLILTEMTRTLGLLVAAGTPILESLNVVSHTTGNVLYRESLLEVATKVEKGLQLGASLSQDPRFPLILTQMVRIGETTGKVEDSLSRVSTYFESETTRTIATLTTLLEPMIIVVLGVGVGFLIISVITPIYNLTSAIK